jgi:hypothetical protein
MQARKERVASGWSAPLAEAMGETWAAGSRRRGVGDEAAARRFELRIARLVGFAMACLSPERRATAVRERTAAL